MLSSYLAGLRSSSSFATALASIPIVDSLVNENAFLSILARYLGGALEWDCSPETERRTVVQPFSTTPVTKDHHNVVSRLGTAIIHMKCIFLHLHMRVQEYALRMAILNLDV